MQSRFVLPPGFDRAADPYRADVPSLAARWPTVRCGRVPVRPWRSSILWRAKIEAGPIAKKPPPGEWSAGRRSD